MNKVQIAIKKLIHNSVPKNIIGTVKAVNEEQYTCDIDPVDGGAEIFDVRLKAVIDNDAVGIIPIPEVGSTVVISALEHNSNALYVSAFGRITKMYINVSSGGKITIQQDGTVELNGNNFNGMVKADELKAQLDKTNDVVNTIVNTLLTWTPVPGDGGAALKTTFASNIIGKETGDFSNIKNDQVTHGSI